MILKKGVLRNSSEHKEANDANVSSINEKHRVIIVTYANGPHLLINGVVYRAPHSQAGAALIIFGGVQSCTFKVVTHGMNPVISSNSRSLSKHEDLF